VTGIGSSTNSRCITTPSEWMEERHSSSCSEAMMCPSHEKPRSTVEPERRPVQEDLSSSWQLRR
jgi:hypothetical protein